MKSKHSGGGNQGYPRTYNYHTSPDNGRQYPRGEPPYHMSGGPGMRAMHHQPPQQPPTPPTQDMKAPPTHMQAPPIHQMPPQQAQQQQQQQGPPPLLYPMNQRPGGPQAQYYRSGPTTSTRPPPRPNLMVQGQGGQQFIPSQQVSYGSMGGIGQPGPIPMMVPHQFSMNPGTANQRVYMTPAGQYINQNFFHMLPYPQAQVVRPPQMPNSQIMMQQPPQTVGVAPGVMTQPPEPPSAGMRKRPRPNAIKITDPNDGHDVLEAMLKEEDTPPGSGESSARETPQLTSSLVASEFARKVASTLGDEAVRPTSRNSTYSESEPQPGTEMQQQTIPREGMVSPKLEPGAEMVVVPGGLVSDAPLVENSMPAYGPEQGIPRWVPPVPVQVPMEHMGVPMHPPPLMVMTPEDMMRQPMHPPPREFQTVPAWQQEPPPVVTNAALPPNMVAGMGPALTMPGSVPVVPPVAPSAKKPDRTTPVVSALAHGPTVDIGREYPVLGGQRHPGTHQSPIRGKRRPAERATSPSVPPPATVVLPSAPPAPAPVSVPVQIERPPVLEEPKAPSPTPAAPPTVPVEEPPPPVVVATPVPPPQQQQEPPVVTPAPVEAKVSHQKSKSNKRQQQRQEQQRQATPPPRPVTPAAAVPPTAPPAEAAPPAAERAVSPPPPAVTEPKVKLAQPEVAPAPAPAPGVAVRDPTPPPAVMQVVDEPAPRASPPKQPEPVPEIVATPDEVREDRLVAKMNEENNKLTASNKLADKNNVLDNNNGLDNNNSVPSVTVLVEPSSPISEATPVIENAKPILKHAYKEDQWSPLNQEGKKQYNREFIMLLQRDPASIKRPENLPTLEVLKDSRGRGEPMRGSSMQPRMGDIPLPGYMNKSSSLRGSSRDGRRDDRDGHLKRSSLLGKQKSAKPMPIQVSLSLNEDVKLRECETPWKPTRVQDSQEMTEDEKKTESLNKKVRGVLNRLTPQKFNKLVNQVQALPIDTPERLKGVIDLVFDKAVDEPGFSVAYAEMCNVLSKMSVKDQEGKPANFRIILIQRCQAEFEKPVDETGREKRLQVIEQESDPAKKKELMSQLEEDERKVRVKAVGNIRFIGELFKLRMLTSYIMYTCIEHLLRLNSEESLECLCKLLTTIGKSLEDETNAARELKQSQLVEVRKSGDKDAIAKAQSALQGVGDLNKYFDELQRMVKSKDKKISSRVKFMIQDLIDLREGRWIPRRDDSAPKTMDQIAKEAEREQMESNLAINAAGLDNKRGGGGGQERRQDSRSSMDNRGRRGGGGGGQDNSGWTQVASNTRKQYVETNKLRVSNVELDLGLSLGSRHHYIWNKGSGSKSDERKQPEGGFGMTQNKYALLEEKQPTARSSLKDGLPSGAEPRDARPVSLRPSLQEEGRNSRSSQQFRPDSGPTSRDNSRDRLRDMIHDGPDTASPHSEPPAILNEKAVRTLVDEFVHSPDFEEASRFFEESFVDSVKGELVLYMFLHALEKTMATRRGSSRLLSHLLQTYGLTQAHFFEGLKGFLEQADDLIVDIPRLWEYFAEILADVVRDVMGLGPILEALGPAAPGPLRAVAKILQIIGSEKPDAPALAASVPALRMYLGSADSYKAFLRDHSLEFIESKPVAVERVWDEERIAAELARMLRASIDFDLVNEWINTNVGPATAEPAFIKALTNALLDSCLFRNKNDTWKLELDTLKKNMNLMQRYVDNTGPRELQCLYAIQTKMNRLEHPKGVLCDLCQLLHDTGVISSDSFKNWRASKETQNMEGRGVCMTSLTSFFTMIDEDEDEAS